MPLWQSIGIGQVPANFKTKYMVLHRLVKSGIGASLLISKFDFKTQGIIDCVGDLAKNAWALINYNIYLSGACQI